MGTNSLSPTFTLDLNSALAQVLAAQGGGSQSLFLPGVGQQLNGDWLFPHGDALGSVRHVTSAAGELLGSMSYSPFGERVESTGVLPFLGFTGEPQQPASDLTYLRARYYHPALGRFLTVDPFPGYLELPATLHPYSYVLSDPLNLTDPSGENPIVVGILLGGGIDLAAQLLANGGRWECINWDQVVISAAVGGLGGWWGGRLASIGSAHPLASPIRSFFGTGVGRILGNSVGSGMISGGGTVLLNVYRGNDLRQGVARSAVAGGVLAGLATFLDDLLSSTARSMAEWMDMRDLVRRSPSRMLTEPRTSERLKVPERGALFGASVGFPLSNSAPALDQWLPWPRNLQTPWWEAPAAPVLCGCG